VLGAGLGGVIASAKLLVLMTKMMTTATMSAPMIHDFIKISLHKYLKWVSLQDTLEESSKD